MSELETVIIFSAGTMPLGNPITGPNMPHRIISYEPWDYQILKVSKESATFLSLRYTDGLVGTCSSTHFDRMAQHSFITHLIVEMLHK